MYLTNYAGYLWDPNQPDKQAAGPWQNCIQMWIRIESADPNFPYATYQNGNVDDAM